MDDLDLLEEEQAQGKPIKPLPQSIPITSTIISATQRGSLLAAWYFANTFRY